MQNGNQDVTRSRRGMAAPFFLAAIAVVLVVSSVRAAAQEQAPRAKAVQVPAGAAPAAVRAYFGKDCERALRTEIYGARQEILVAIYTITRKSIYSALVAMSRRGVKVRVKFDMDQMKDSEDMKKAVQYLRDNGVPCESIQLKDDKAKMHHKFAVIDRKRVATGSFNYSASASRVNYENLVIIDSPAIAKSFTGEFERIKGD